MTGRVIKGTSIVVDYWTHSDFSKIYFLSHLHLDHIENLTSSWCLPIYTSPLNRLLLKDKFQFADNVVIPLELDVPHILTMEPAGQETFTVTLLNANHVPGAVMFFLQGKFGYILYCGDMRFYPELFNHPVLSVAIERGGIDILYLDNTFAKPIYDFPPREEAMEDVFHIIDQHPNYTIRLGIRNLGKEDLLEFIAQKYQELILVDAERFKQLKILRRPNVYTMDPMQARFHVGNINFMHRRNHRACNQTRPTISILLTAIYYGLPPDESSLLRTEGFFIVPYSDHSSWPELMTFVRGVKPRKIIPIIKDPNKKDSISITLQGRDDMTPFSALLASPVSSPSPRNSPPKLNQSHPFPYQDSELPSKLKRKIRKRKIIRRVSRRKVPRGVIFTPLEESTACDLSSKRNEFFISETPLNSNENHACGSGSSGNPFQPPQGSPIPSQAKETPPQSKARKDVLLYNKNIICQEHKKMTQLSYANAKMTSSTIKTVINDEQSSSHNLSPNIGVAAQSNTARISTCKLLARETLKGDIYQKTKIPFGQPSKFDTTSLNKSSRIERQTTDCPQSSKPTNSFESAQNIFAKAIQETKYLVQKMKLNPHLDIDEILFKGFKVCNLMQRVKNSF